ncbi:beta-oxoacyl-ACP reductase, partial [mine drainage metagenome]
MTADQWDEVIDVNLTGIYQATRAFVEEITRSACGRIVNLSSVVGLAGN